MAFHKTLSPNLITVWAERFWSNKRPNTLFKSPKIRSPNLFVAPGQTWNESRKTWIFDAFSNQQRYWPRFLENQFKPLLLQLVNCVHLLRTSYKSHLWPNSKCTKSMWTRSVRKMPSKRRINLILCITFFTDNLHSYWSFYSNSNLALWLNKGSLSFHNWMNFQRICNPSCNFFWKKCNISSFFAYFILVKCKPQHKLL